ncbi:hypothetical protein EOA60_09725 [Mesorhizobium sp. M1A.F.Ca.IN.020.06.1.1]|uniref:hypothetical protein n=1 Tax=unclassified Mesorhizobium TaxID=325217 RepID=UPI000FCB0C17|nr:MULTISPECIES: hypothetical protein [unclassified Mesorhizobium]RUV90261.1 hypothetical protein EOA51_00655 [Mesorhizobium sp. M1A.F.Ca.IN.020.32.1.1]RUW12736.1 hypothetical protein EOA46_08490 [Mesorhizobium sp. M1A.F.Ca.IN.022.05.2.1]RUW32299.1 hypothetical protein EOA60_09725 [Mesorhizobium sp. M1A.F.Ca.IN.020.06.1.1]RWF82262.1 MAG: hypothetical protein EOQ35_10870 [Mesorhizobium sp.]RWG04183.1 MAG: hypothetical protein EOQ38_06485 [Mesorhizobium sp.]
MHPTSNDDDKMAREMDLAPGVLEAIIEMSSRFVHTRNAIIDDWVNLANTTWADLRQQLQRFVDVGVGLPDYKRMIAEVDARRAERTSVANSQFPQLQALLRGYVTNIRVLTDRQFSTEHQALCRILSASAEGETALDALAEIYRREASRRGLAHPSEPSPF